jgi:hypothetical protein
VSFQKTISDYFFPELLVSELFYSGFTIPEYVALNVRMIEELERIF